jgi:phosphatidylinositol dimannoside acyltransferase
VTARNRLEAPHRRLEPESRGSRVAERVKERLAILGYRAGAWVVGHLPAGLSRFVIARAFQLAYLAWPTKRAWSNANFARVLGLPPGDRRVRATALAAYGEYARYLVEVMRLPRLPRERATELVVSADLDQVEPIWREARGGLIIALAHLGNGEMAAAGVASRGWPISVLADDSSYPELFEHFRRSRGEWGVNVIPWRNIREVYGVLKRREMLGLFVDWGYRSDGIPVRLFGAWTTFPAGPAALAAKTGSRILPTAIRRLPDGRTFTITLGEPIDVPSMSPADQLEATQRLAHSIEASIAAAPQQWYSFKPVWPADPAEGEELERRARAMAAGVMPEPVRAAALATAPEAAPA